MVPRAELKTARLMLRPVVAEDEEAVVAALDDLAVSGWLAVVPYPYEGKDFQYFLTEIARPGVAFAVCDAEGLAGIMSIEDEILGYWFAPRCHGRGYATEAGRAVVAGQFATSPVDVISGYFEGNLRSANVLRKLGFVETGRDMRHCRAMATDRPHVNVGLTLQGFKAALPVEATSARLTYRSLQPVDFTGLHDIGSDWEVVRQLGSWPWPPAPDFTASRAAPYLGAGFVWGVFLGGDMIGTVSVTGELLGYSVKKSYWRQGFGEEAVRTALGWAFQRVGQVTASVWVDNAASLGLLRKLGFAEIGRSVEMSKARNVEVGLVHLVLDRDLWSPSP